MDQKEFDEKAKKILESNTESLKEINRLLNIIEESNKKKETAFKELGITPEMEEESKHLSPLDLSTSEQKLFEYIQKEFLEDLASKGMDEDLKKAEKTKSKTNLTLSRKRLRI